MGTPPVSLKSLKGDFYNLKPGCPITIGSILFTKIEVDAPKVEIVATKPAVKNAKSGQVRYRTDKNGIVHCSVGKASFDREAIKKNIEALLVDLKKAKPAGAKGTYLKKVVLSSTMGPGLAVDISSLSI